MNTFEYIVESIDGDYAHLRRIDEESDELKLVARALLPRRLSKEASCCTSGCSTQLWNKLRMNYESPMISRPN